MLEYLVTQVLQVIQVYNCGYGSKNLGGYKSFFN